MLLFDVLVQWIIQVVATTNLGDKHSVTSWMAKTTCRSGKRCLSGNQTVYLLAVSLAANPMTDMGGGGWRGRVLRAADTWKIEPNR